VDVVLHRDGRKIVVQCKRWTNKPVPVQIVRELYGVMHDQNAIGGKLITTSSFTSETAAFAKGKPIELIGANELLRLIRSVQTSGQAAAVPPALSSLRATSVGQAQQCPVCNSVMVKRTARRGANAGSDFWGCSNYPKCKGTRKI
jgi:restriction system protein